MDWQVILTADLNREPSDDTLRDLVDSLDEQQAVIGGPTSYAPHSVSAIMTIEAVPTPRAAIDEGSAAFVLAVVQAGYSIEAWTEAEAITTAEADRRIETPTIPELVSGKEAAEILGVSRQRVHQLANDHPDFPEPVAHLANGKIWLLASIEGFARRWTRTPGRPKSHDVIEAGL